MYADASTNPRLIQLPKIGDAAIGFISILEPPLAPFIAKRVYWTYGTPREVVRGNHAHKTLHQVLVAVSGRAVVTIETRRSVKGEFILDTPSAGLYLPAGCWRTLRFTADTVLLTVASDVFHEDDYIRNYDEFRRWSNLD